MRFPRGDGSVNVES